MNGRFNTAMTDHLNEAMAQRKITPKEVQLPSPSPRQTTYSSYHSAHRAERNEQRSISTNVDEGIWRKAEDLRNRFNIAIAPMIRSAVCDAIQRRWEREMRAGRAA